MKVIPGMKGWFNIQYQLIYHINRIKDKPHIFNRKYIKQNSTTIHDKISQQIRNKREFPQPDKGTYEKYTNNILRNVETLNAVLIIWT